MSQGATHDKDTGDAARATALHAPKFVRGRGVKLMAANDNRPDWRSLFAQRISRPLHRLVALYVRAVQRIWAWFR